MPTDLGLNPMFQSDQQPSMRRSFTAKDQWGRLWSVVTENKTGDLTGVPTRFRWADPINTPVKFVRIDPRDPNRVLIDYAGWIVELEEGHRIWQQRYETEGFARYGEKFNPDEEPPPYLRRQIGPKPFDPEIVRKAATGDPQYLGVTPEPSSEQKVKELEQRIKELEAEKKARHVAELKDKLTQPLVNRAKKED